MIHSFFSFIAILNSNVNNRTLFCRVPFSRFIVKVLHLLFQSGFISGYRLFSSSYVDVYYKYFMNQNCIRSIKVISKPGRRRFFSYKQLHRHFLKFNSSCIVVSTSQGLMTNHDIASSKIGGELLFVIS